MTDIARTIAIVVAHTPAWVWALYGLLLFLGFQRTRDSSVPLIRILILPLVVAGLAIWSSIAAGPGGLPVVPLGLVLGGTAGWQLEREGATRRLADGRIWLRGEWWSFTQLLAMLVFRYVTNVVAIMDPVLNADPIWHFVSLFLSAALSALFLGRSFARVRVYFVRRTAA